MKKTRNNGHSAGKVITVIFAVVVIGALGFFLFRMLGTQDYNKIGADAYYTRITGAGEPQENNYTDSHGKQQVDVRYRYDLKAYDQSGQARDLDFTASKQLRKDAYLKVYYKKGKGVTTFEEVQKNKLPAKAAAKL